MATTSQSFPQLPADAKRGPLVAAGPEVVPGGSVKDRPAKNMLEVGIAEGKLKPGKVILDSTSGNTGIALAMLGAALGYPVELVMPSNVSRERKKIIEAYGAKIHFSDSMEGSDGAIIMCRELIAKNSERYFK